MPRKRGRPPLGKAARSKTVRVRLTPVLLRAVEAAAARDGVSLSAWGLEQFERALIGR